MNHEEFEARMKNIAYMMELTPDDEEFRYIWIYRHNKYCDECWEEAADRLMSEIEKL